MSLFDYVKYIFYFFILILFIGILTFWYNAHDLTTERQVVSAYLRVKNEIKTIEACLNSIDGIFDKIVIIHSNEPDDGSIELMNRWCAARNYCEIHEYPYRVIPSHSKDYSMNIDEKNTLAAYNNWGLQFFSPEEWVVKIDADQVYIRSRLQKIIDMFRFGIIKENYQYGLTGYNTFVYKNKLVNFVAFLNGGIDSYIIKRKYMKFYQDGYVERNDFSVFPAFIFEPVWFHFLKTLKQDGVVRAVEEAKQKEIVLLSNEEAEIFNKEIRPLLKTSAYYKVETSIE